MEAIPYKKHARFLKIVRVLIFSSALIYHSILNNEFRYTVGVTPVCLLKTVLKC